MGRCATVRDDGATGRRGDADPATEPTLGEVVARPQKLAARSFFVGSGADRRSGASSTSPASRRSTRSGRCPAFGRFISAFALLEAADLRPTAIYMHPGAWSDLLGIKEARQRRAGARLYRRRPGCGDEVDPGRARLTRASQMPLDKIGVAQADQIVAVRRQEAGSRPRPRRLEQDRWDCADSVQAALTGRRHAGGRRDRDHGVMVPQARRRPRRRAQEEGRSTPSSPRQWEHDGVSSYVDPCPSD